MSKFEEDHYIHDLRNRLGDDDDHHFSKNIIGASQKSHSSRLDPLGHNQSKSSLRVKADYKPEIFFIGQIVGGSDFPTEVDGLFVEATLKYGENWKMFDKVQTLQTHTSYCDDEGFFVFAHPFDFHFICESVQGWPKLNLKVWRLDQYGKIDNIAYGVVNLPNETGSFEIECPTWRPMSGWREESYSYYLGGPPKLLNSDPIVRDLNQRRFLTSMSSGTVHIHCEVLMKAFRDSFISGDK